MAARHVSPFTATSELKRQVEESKSQPGYFRRRGRQLRSNPSHALADGIKGQLRGGFMIWNWADVTAEQVESPMVYGAEMIDYPPGDGLPELGPGRNWAKCVPPQTIKKLLGRPTTGGAPGSALPRCRLARSSLGLASEVLGYEAQHDRGWRSSAAELQLRGRAVGIRHGVKQPRNPWFDGPEYITQCGISAGSNFTYQILFSSEEGTLWWHAHSDWTRSTVHGAIVIWPALGKSYPFPHPDEEHAIVLASWYKQDVMALMNYALEHGGEAKLSDAYCINGQPGDFYPCSNESTTKIKFDHGKTYLLRIVNAVMNTDFFIGIADHNLTVVGWDAAYIKPIYNNYLIITPGQTLDVLVTANQAPGRYYFIASPYFDGQTDDFDKTITSAIFEYNGDYDRSIIPSYPYDVPYFYDIGAASYFWRKTRSLASEEHPIDLPMNISTRMYVVISMNLLHCPNSSCDGPDGDRLAAGFNNITFANPEVDILQAYYWNLSGYYDTNFPIMPAYWYNFTSEDLISDNVTLSLQATKVRMLDYNETVEMVFQGTNVLDSGENHPIHLHGFRFYVVATGSMVYALSFRPAYELGYGCCFHSKRWRDTRDKHSRTAFRIANL
ncbi:hypothetical protein HYC85_008140 [Camellia sinensis]|uniref:laccase n=1 Tax=Camellia sinensis TaxID=4442 RepID=A0A7J7HTB6_CAMSI|nr:hypothetical protein HYC85_008140 [Camellia sinensis]